MNRLRVRWWWLLMVLVVGYVAAATIYASQAMSGRVTAGAIPRIGGVAEAPVTLTNGGIRLDGGFYDNPADGSCVVILVHGIDADRSAVLTYAPLYWDLGCSLFAFDHRDHGRSSGAPRSYGFHESGDAQLAIEWVRARTGLAPDRIGLHGVSFGAATVLEVLDIRDDLAFVVADSPYRSMAAIVSRTAGQSLGIAEPLVRPLAFFLIERRAAMQIGAVDPTAAVAARETPILLLHTAGDAIVPVEHSAAIAAANPAIERHVIAAGGIHLHAYRERPAEYATIVHDFIRRTAPQLGP